MEKFEEKIFVPEIKYIKTLGLIRTKRNGLTGINAIFKRLKAKCLSLFLERIN